MESGANLSLGQSLADALIARPSAEAGAAVRGVYSTDWASATFHGSRHRLLLRIEGAGAADRADAFTQELDRNEFVTPGHIVADIVVTCRFDDDDCVDLVVEALTVEDQ